MAKVVEGQLMMNLSNDAMRKGELLWVIEKDEETKRHYAPKVIVQNRLGYMIKVGLDDLAEVSFFLHKDYGVVYLPKYGLSAIMSAGGNLSDSVVAVFTMFTESQTGYDRSIKKESVQLRELVYLGDVNDLDRSDKYDKPKEG
jgi:hypothetical protein